LTGDIASGGSTLTQQLARSYFLSLEQTAARKFKEAALAVRIEQEFTKEQIMELFLNKMFFGQRAYGVAAAAQVFFNKPLTAISVPEAATLAGVLPAPTRYNPVRSPVNATMRRGYVLGRMRDLDFIDETEYTAAMDFPMESRLHGARVELNAPYVAEMVRREMLSRYGDETYTAGYQVVTALDSKLQRASNFAVRNGLLEFTRRRGYRGPITTVELPPELPGMTMHEWPPELLSVLDRYAPGGLSVALVTAVSDSNTVDIVFRDGTAASIPWNGISWAKPFVDRETTGPAPEAAADVLTPGDVIYVMPTAAGFWALAQVPEAQGALVSVDPADGAVTSLVGGFDFGTTKFNRATQAFRQPGSSFKPFIYSAALEHGNTPATVVLDAPVVITSSELEAVWRPINYSGRFYGPTRMREALVRSMNLVSVRLLLFETGIGNAVRHIAKFGFGDAALPHNGSLALGRANPSVVCIPCVAEPADDFGFVPPEGMTLDEMVDIALSYRPDASVDPELFARINAAPRAISPQNAFLVQDMMRDVIRRGTGRRALQLGRRDLSGKTGTSNDRRDAWFGGFNGDLASVVWVGYDDDLPLGPGEEGSRTALPIWIEFIRLALAGVPEHQMPMPEGIVSVRIAKQTGCPARAGQPDVTFEMFREGHVPECETVEEPPDIFNDTTGLDDPAGGEEDPPEGDEEPVESGEDEEEQEEPLF
jgi:penicillin-binding protein 1A